MTRFVIKHCMFLWKFKVTRPTSQCHVYQQSMTFVPPGLRLDYGRCQTSYNASVHPPHFQPSHPAHLHTWKQTRRLNTQNPEVSGVESLTRLTNRPLCSHQLTTPLPTVTGLFEPHCLTYQLSVDTTQAGSRSTDCGLYHTGTAFMLKFQLAHSDIKQNSFKMAFFFVCVVLFFVLKFYSSYQEVKMDCGETTQREKNRLFQVF